MKLDPYLTFKNLTKEVKDLHIQPDTMKLLEENIVKMLFNIGFGNEVLDLSPKQQWQPSEIISNLSFCIATEAINKMKWQRSKWEKTFCQPCIK